MIEVLNYEPENIPRVFSQYGLPYRSNKSTLLEKIGTESPHGTVSVVDISHIGVGSTAKGTVSVVDISHIGVGSTAKGKTFRFLCQLVNDGLTEICRVEMAPVP